MSNNSKIVLITGATAGIGRETALHLAKQGHHVIASGRKTRELAVLKTEAETLKVKLDTVVLDVTSAASIASGRSQRCAAAGAVSPARFYGGTT